MGILSSMAKRKNNKTNKRRGKNERHYMNLDAQKSLWSSFRDVMRKDSIKTYTAAFRYLMREAVRRGYILDE